MDFTSLYVHIPFCRHRCSYCDFNTYTSVGDLQDAYSAALVHEIIQVAERAGNVGQLRTLNTMFFGGGTPSLLTGRQVQDIVHSAESRFGFTADAEITLEANPETVDYDYLAAIRNAGVNRLSFGMQSADPNELQLLGRTHDVSIVVDAVDKARAAGFDNFNLDLIFGLPGQKLASWETSLNKALSLQPAHLSLYCLTVEQGTPMDRWLQNGRIQAPDPDMAAAQYELSCRMLAEAGYEHYEISNWAIPGHECRHNLAYWRDKEYLGLGAGAHGKASGFRYSVVRRPRVYIKRMENDEEYTYPLSPAVAEAHLVDRQEAMTDRVITQLRLLQEGLDLLAFENQFGQTIDDAFVGVVEQLESWDLLRRESERLFLTERSWFISNQVFYRFF